MYSLTRRRLLSFYVDAADIQPNSPRTEPGVGGDMTVAELCRAILEMSDNTAPNILLRDVGRPAIMAWARGIGDPPSRLDRYEIELNSTVPGNSRDTSTPAGLGSGDYGTTNDGTTNDGTTNDGTTNDGTTNDGGIAHRPQGQRLLPAVITRSATDDQNGRTCGG